MNVWIRSFAALALLAGPSFLNVPTGAAFLPKAAVTALPAPAPAQDALTTLAARPDGPLPSGTRLLSVRVAGGLATVDFSRELRDSFTGGDSGEARTVNAVLGTLGRFPTISRVQILVEGRPIDSLGGLLSLSDPLPVLRPATDAPGPAASKRWLHRRTPVPQHGPKTHVR